MGIFSDLRDTLKEGKDVLDACGELRKAIKDARDGGIQPGEMEVIVEAFAALNVEVAEFLGAGTAFGQEIAQLIREKFKKQ